MLEIDLLVKVVGSVFIKIKMIQIILNQPVVGSGLREDMQMLEVDLIKTLYPFLLVVEQQVLPLPYLFQ